jgi:hypothetical protein
MGGQFHDFFNDWQFRKAVYGHHAERGVRDLYLVIDIHLLLRLVRLSGANVFHS